MAKVKFDPKNPWSQINLSKPRKKTGKGKGKPKGGSGKGGKGGAFGS